MEECLIIFVEKFPFVGSDEKVDHFIPSVLAEPPFQDVFFIEHSPSEYQSGSIKTGAQKLRRLNLNRSLIQPASQQQQRTG